VVGGITGLRVLPERWAWLGLWLGCTGPGQRGAVAICDTRRGALPIVLTVLRRRIRESRLPDNVSNAPPLIRIALPTAAHPLRPAHLCLPPLTRTSPSFRHHYCSSWCPRIRTRACPEPSNSSPHPTPASRVQPGLGGARALAIRRIRIAQRSLP
jgi:hypothetical protein